MVTAAGILMGKFGGGSPPVVVIGYLLVIFGGIGVFFNLNDIKDAIR